MANPNPQLQAALTRFAAQPGVTPDQAAQLAAAVTREARLLQRLNDAAANGHLTGFALPAAGAVPNLVGSYDKASGVVTLPPGDFQPTGSVPGNVVASLRANDIAMRYAGCRINVRNALFRLVCRTRLAVEAIFLVTLCCGCAHSMKASDASIPAEEHVMVIEPSPAHDATYSFRFTCHPADGSASRVIQITGIILPIDSDGRISSVISVTIDGNPLPSHKLRLINSHFPERAVQERPWIACDGRRILIDIPYRDDKNDFVHFSVDENGELQFE